MRGSLVWRGSKGAEDAHESTADNVLLAHAPYAHRVPRPASGDLQLDPAVADEAAVLVADRELRRRRVGEADDALAVGRPSRPVPNSTVAGMTLYPWKKSTT